jgi:hypothetical protein
MPIFPELSTVTQLAAALQSQMVLYCWITPGGAAQARTVAITRAVKALAKSVRADRLK